MNQKGIVHQGNFYKLPLVNVSGQNGDGTYRQELLNCISAGEQLKIRYYSDGIKMRVGIYNMNGSALGDLPENFTEEIIKKIQRFGDPVVRASAVEGSGANSNKGLIVTIDFH